MKNRLKLLLPDFGEKIFRGYSQQGFAHFLIVVVIAAAAGVVLLYFYKDNFNFKPFQPQSNIDQACCLKCHNIANPENEASGSSKEEKSCLESTDLGKECKDFFQKNPERGKECSNSQLETLAIPTATPGKGEEGNNGGLGGLFGKLTGQKCDHEYVWWRDMEEIEKRFKDKKWSGTLTGESYCPNGDGYEYKVQVKDLHIVFDSDLDGLLKSSRGYKKANIWTPCSDEAFYGGLGLKTKGSATITYSTFKNQSKASSMSGVCGYTCTVTNNPIPFNLIGKIMFTDEGLVVVNTAEKIGVDTQKLLETCGQENSNCDEEKILNDTQIKMEGYCRGNYCNDEPFSCTMNKDDDCEHNWHVSELLVEGDVNDEEGGREVEFVNNDRDLKFKKYLGTCDGDGGERKNYLTGTLTLSN
jgi:hypothetical protein